MIYKSGVGEEENSEKESRLEAFCKLAHNKHASPSRTHTHNMNKKDYHPIVLSLGSDDGRRDERRWVVQGVDERLRI